MSTYFSYHFCTDALRQFSSMFLCQKHKEEVQIVPCGVVNRSNIYYTFLNGCLHLLSAAGCQELLFDSMIAFLLRIFFRIPTPGQPVSPLTVETMENFTIKDEAVHQRAPENPVHKISSSKLICNFFQKWITPFLLK